MEGGDTWMMPKPTHPTPWATVRMVVDESTIPQGGLCGFAFGDYYRQQNFVTIICLYGTTARVKQGKLGVITVARASYFSPWGSCSFRMVGVVKDCLVGGLPGL